MVASQHSVVWASYFCSLSLTFLVGTLGGKQWLPHLEKMAQATTWRSATPRGPGRIPEMGLMGGVPATAEGGVCDQGPQWSYLSSRILCCGPGVLRPARCCSYIISFHPHNSSCERHVPHFTDKEIEA